MKWRGDWEENAVFGGAVGQEDRIPAGLLFCFLPRFAGIIIAIRLLRQQANSQAEPRRGADFSAPVFARAMGVDLGGRIPVGCIWTAVTELYLRPRYTLGEREPVG